MALANRRTGSLFTLHQPPPKRRAPVDAGQEGSFSIACPDTVRRAGALSMSSADGGEECTPPPGRWDKQHPAAWGWPWLPPPLGQPVSE